MNWWRHIVFDDPWWLLLLVVLPLLVWWYRRHQAHRRHGLSVALADHEGLPTSWRVHIARLLPWLFLLGMVLVIIAMARPQRVLSEEEIDADGIDIMLVMDLSSSMLSKDFDPDRLEVSKQVAADFVDRRIYDRIGLVSFAGEAYTMSPLTSDHDVIKSLLHQLRSGYLSDGTAIGMGLATAVNRLHDSEAKSKVIIFLTDGVNNTGEIDPVQATELASKFGIKIYTVGVGSAGMALTPIGRNRDGSFRYAHARVEIDERLLTYMAEQTGGNYYRALDEASLQKIYAKIDELEKTEMEVTVVRRYEDYFPYFLTTALILMTLTQILRYSWLKIWPDKYV